jgi:glycosidase
MKRTHCLAVLLSYGSFTLAHVMADELSVNRIGPPSWWVSSELQQISLLIEGSCLIDTRVSAHGNAAVVIDRVEPGLDGRAIFVDLTIQANAEAGAIELEIESHGGRIQRPWQLLPKPEYLPRLLGPDDVIYLIMPDRFANGDPTNDQPANEDLMLDRGYHEAYHGGDFRGLRQRLSYLADLGVTAIWLTPVYHQGPRWFFSGTAEKKARFAPYHGYSPINFYDTNPRFGSFQEYGELVAEAHRLGLKVIQDQIVGYTGPHHPWVTRAPACDWFHGPMDQPPAQTFRFEALADPAASEAEGRGVSDGWFFGILPDLATRNVRVRQYAIQQSLWWTTFGAADGIRLDTFPMVERDFWRDWDRRLKLNYPGFVAIGEAWTSDAKLLSFFQGGRAGWDGIDPGVTSVFDFPLHAAIAATFTGRGPASLLSDAIEADRASPRPDLLVTFLDNHDMPRLSQSGASLNRLRLAAAFLLTTRGIPQITWGDELGLPPGVDHRREFPGGFPDDPRDAFTKLGRTPEERVMFDTWCTLLQLRKQTPAMRQGTLTDLIISDDTYAYMREVMDDRVMTILNLSDRSKELTVPISASGSVADIRRLYGDGKATVTSDWLRVEMPGESAAIFRLSR